MSKRRYLRKLNPQHFRFISISHKSINFFSNSEFCSFKNMFKIIFYIFKYSIYSSNFKIQFFQIFTHRTYLNWLHTCQIGLVADIRKAHTHACTYTNTQTLYRTQTFHSTHQTLFSNITLTRNLCRHSYFSNALPDILNIFLVA